MITVSILEDNDEFRADDWCRPLNLDESSGGEVQTRSTYGGFPINNLKWVPAKHVATAHIGSTVGAFNKLMERFGLRYEFIRGAVPVEHQLDLEGYSLLS